jgi:hypothetical protein
MKSAININSLQSSWLQIQRSGFDPGRYQIFWEIVGPERSPLSLVSTTEELLERKSSGFGLEILEYDRRDPSRSQRGTLYPQKLALTSPTSGGRSIGIVRSRTQATEFSLVFPYTRLQPLSAPSLLGSTAFLSGLGLSSLSSYANKIWHLLT